MRVVPIPIEKVLRDPTSQIQFILFPQSCPFRPEAPRENFELRKLRLGRGLISLRSGFFAIPQAWLPPSLWSLNQRQRPHFACLPNAAASFLGDPWRSQHLPCAPSRPGVNSSLNSAASCPVRLAFCLPLPSFHLLAPEVFRRWQLLGQWVSISPTPSPCSI